MAAKHPGWGWYFVYTREAHPGEHLAAHRTQQDKVSAARRLRDEVGITRPILVDDIDGPVHTAYGLLPNMTWVIGRRGVILYKGMWTSASEVDDYVADATAHARSMVHAPFWTEQMRFRRRDRDAFMRRLEVNGPRSVAEFRRAMEIWAERDAADRPRGPASE